MAADFDDRVIYHLAFGSEPDLNALAAESQSFPSGTNSFGRPWILNAVWSGHAAVVAWFLERRVDLDFITEEGLTPIHAALDLEAPANRHEILQMLLNAGAPVNGRGINDWTPAHLAAARDDVASLKILIEHGADLTLRTRIDAYATPLEEARRLNRHQAVRLLEAQA